jgi:hypothetical protein
MTCEVGRLSAAGARAIIEFGGLAVKAGIVDFTGDRVTILGAPICVAEKLTK